jgi:hypothetical protein
MNRVLILVFLVFSAATFAQAPQISSGSTVYIEPMNGYETYLAAALSKKNVPLLIVADRNKADFIISSTVGQSRPSQPTTVINNTASVGNSGNDAWNQGWSSGQQAAARRAAMGSTSVSVAVIDPRSSQVVFAYSAGKAGGKQLQRTAEDCAKHLKESIEKAEKGKK